MSLDVYSLASGSSGNAMLLRGIHGDILMDCGMPRAFIESSISEVGGAPLRLRAILLTHEHTDHARGALAVARRYAAPIVGSSGTLDEVAGMADVATVRIAAGCPTEIGGFEVTGCPVQHDAREPFAFKIKAGSTFVCYAVDLGAPSESLLDDFGSSSLLILESNHDEVRLRRGPYDAALKSRILGESGHLSNEAASAVLTRVSDGRRPMQFWLAHLSAVNNTPTAALRTATRALRLAGRGHCGVQVALRDRPSIRWSSTDQWWQPALDL